MSKFIPDGELTFHDWESCQTVADILLNEGYVLLLSREEQLFILNYIWSSEEADRNDVVFMDRAEFEEKFYEETDWDEDDDVKLDHIQQETRSDTIGEVWRAAQKLLGMSPAEIEKVFGVDDADEKTQDRFWQMFPDQISYFEAKVRVDEWQREHYKAIGEAVMKAALDHWDNLTKMEYEEKLEEGSVRSDKVAGYSTNVGALNNGDDIT